MTTAVSVKQAPQVDYTNAFSVTVTEYGMSETYTVWTGSDGKGLWQDGRQIEGLAQFNAGANPAQAIRRYYQHRD